MTPTPLWKYACAWSLHPSPTLTFVINVGAVIQGLPSFLGFSFMMAAVIHFDTCHNESTSGERLGPGFWVKGKLSCTRLHDMSYHTLNEKKYRFLPHQWRFGKSHCKEFTLCMRPCSFRGYCFWNRLDYCDYVRSLRFGFWPLSSS